MHSAAVITISDSRSAGTARDESGPAAVALLRDMEIKSAARESILIMPSLLRRS